MASDNEIRPSEVAARAVEMLQAQTNPDKELPLKNSRTLQAKEHAAGPRASFQILSGADEARAEHLAAVACTEWAGIATPDGSPVLLASSGGVSMQFTSAMGRFFSIRCSVGEGGVGVWCSR